METFLLLLPLAVEVFLMGPCFVFCFSVPFNSLAILLRKRERAGYSLLIVLLLSVYVSLPHGVIGWSAVCECDIS